MTDRELLELAAKAAGYSGIRPSSFYADTYVVQVGEHEWTPWRPLTDDGDALRLAVKLRLNVYCPPGKGASASCYVEELDRCIYMNEKEGDAAATRRAIVRAAAELASVA